LGGFIFAELAARLLGVILLNKLLQGLMALLVRGFLVKHASLDNLVVEVFLTHSARQDTFFDDGASDQSVYSHLRLLSDSVCTVLRLLIHLWIEVRIEDDYSVCHL